MVVAGMQGQLNVDTQTHVERALARYIHVYQALYQRPPSQLQDLGEGWVLVNGAQMRVEELEHLSDQLSAEYQQALANKRGIVKRLLAWFSKA